MSHGRATAGPAGTTANHCWLRSIVGDPMSTETAEPVTWLDAESVEELQPPCDSTKDSNAAEWFIVWICPRCGTFPHLYCRRCHERIMQYLSADPLQTFSHALACEQGGVRVLRMGRL